MLEAGEIVIVTVAVGLLCALCCCGVCAVFLYHDKEEKRSTSRVHGPRLEEALPPVTVGPVTVDQSIATGGTRVVPGRRRRDSATQTDNEDNAEIVMEEDLRSTPTVITRPTKLTKRLQIAAAPAEAMATQHQTSEFVSDLSHLRDSPHSVFADEFEILRRRAVARWKSREVAAMNPRKNRYEDAVPYDENRVLLSGNEYINASYIDSYLSAKHFIATQWPISQYELSNREETVGDFWKMIWEKNVQSIVAISGRNETLSAYWPPQRSLRQYSDIKVEQERSYREAGVMVRKFIVEKRGERSEVTHFLLSDWDDGDAADSSKILKVVQRVRRSEKPIVVHCSAGVGRSGVFIAVCRLLDQASQRGLIDVFSVVDTMRQQRPGMVSTRDQYENIYDTLRVAIENKAINTRV